MKGYIAFGFFLCPVTDILAMVAPIGMKVCMMVHNGSGQISFPIGGTRILKIRHFGPKFWPIDHKYFKNGKLQHYINYSLTSDRRELSKNVKLWGGRLQQSAL